MSGSWLKRGQGKVYRAVTTIERRIPALFAALHVALAIIIILELAGILDWAR